MSAVPDNTAPVVPAAHRSPQAMLREIDLDFTKPLCLPDGRSQPPAAAKSWTMAIKKAQMSPREKDLMDAVTRAFERPGAYVTKIGPAYILKAADTLRKLWGVWRRHLLVPQPVTLTMALFDPHHVAYYFRLVASATSPGRNYSPTCLATEVLVLRHLLQAFMSLATRSEAGENCGILFEQMPHGLHPQDVLHWLENDVQRAVSWKPAVGGRKKERDLVCKHVSEAAFEGWVKQVQSNVEGLIVAAESHDLQRTTEMAEYMQDLCVCLLLGAGMPPQRGDVMSSMQLGMGEGRCGVPGCNIDNCKGNRVLSRDDYVQYTGNAIPDGPEPGEDHESYYVIAGHYKNYTGDRATYRGPTVHTPEVTGKHLNFILGQMAAWGSGLLHAMMDETDAISETDDEGSEEVRCRYLLVDYDRRSKAFQSHDHFSQYVKRCTCPVSQPATSFRFLFARMVEYSIDRQRLSLTEADATRDRMARAMLTSVETWKRTYASPRTRIPLPDFQRARDVVYGNGAAASTSSVPS